MKEVVPQLVIVMYMILKGFGKKMNKERKKWVICSIFLILLMFMSVVVPSLVRAS